jgi:hypothetical protein
MSQKLDSNNAYSQVSQAYKKFSYHIFIQKKNF